MHGMVLKFDFLKKFWMDGISKIGFLRLRMDEGKVSNGRKLENW